MRLIDRGSVDPDWAALPVIMSCAGKVEKLEVKIDPDRPEIQRLIKLQETEPVLINAFFNDGTQPSEWPANAVFTFRGRLVELSGKEHVLADAGQRRELLLGLKKWVLLKERKIAGLERDVAALEAVTDEEGPRRTAIPGATRIVVFERDEGRCVVCGSMADLQFDHVIPVAKGGGNAPENLQILCGHCNRQKGENLV